MINDKCPGYTLLEILAVVAIIGLSVALMAPVFPDKANQTRTGRTLESMEEIKKAILGTTSERVRGDIRFAGYVPDMGMLPELYDVLGTPDDITDDQPKGLWTDDPDPEQTEDNLSPYIDYTICDPEGGAGPQIPVKNYISLGWRGPYLKPPAGGVIKDGWENQLIFEIVDKDLIIESMGADGKEGGAGYDEDIKITVRENEYLALVAGYISSHGVYHSKEEIGYECNRQFPPPGDVTPVTVRLYYKPENKCEGRIPRGVPDDFPRFDILRCVEEKAMVAKEDGYFHFDEIPVGTERLLTVTQFIQDDGVNQYILMHYKIEIEPGINWVGNMGIVP